MLCFQLRSGFEQGRHNYVTLNSVGGTGDFTLTRSFQAFLP